MALPSPGFYTSTGGTITSHDFGACEAGAFKPDSTGWSFLIYNDYGSSLGSDTMTSVKLSIRDDDGGIDEIWTQQHWIQLKSDGSSTGATITDDAQTVFSAVGKNKELSIGDIPSGEYRIIYARCYPPTDAAEQNVAFQLRITYQQPATSICNWITGLRGNGVVASTGNPFAMSTGGTTGTIPFELGYALVYNNEVYYGSSGSYDISATSTGTGTYSIYLNESGAFGETTGDVAANQLTLYEATITDGACTALVDKRVYLSGIQSGTTGAMDSNPDLGKIFLDITNGDIYLAKSAGTYTKITDSALANPVASDIEISEIGTATYDDVQGWINNTQSGGRIYGGTITDDSSGGVAISSGQGMIKTTTGNIGLTKTFDWNAGTFVSTGLTDNSINFVYMDYNAGTPQLAVTADRTTIRLQDQFTLGRFYKTGTELHIINTGINLYNAARRSHEMKIEVMGFQRASGGIISESAVTDRALTSSAGVFFLGSNEITTTAKNTSTAGSDEFTTHYYIDGAWARTTGQTAIDATNYNDISATGLTALTVNRYGVHWIYIHADSDIQTVYGQGDYTLTDAENASIPGSLPSEVEDFGKLAAKIIVKKSATGFTSVISAYTSPFPIDTAAVHNDLGGLDSGDYLHLTAIEDAGLNAGEQTIATTTGTANINWQTSRNALFIRSTGADGAVTFTFGIPNVSADLNLIIQSSSTGSTGAVVWPTVYWENGSAPTLSSGMNKIDKVNFYHSTGLGLYLGKGYSNYSTV